MVSHNLGINSWNFHRVIHRIGWRVLVLMQPLSQHHM